MTSIIPDMRDVYNTAYGTAETMRLKYLSDDQGLTWDEYVLLETMTLSPKLQRKVIEWCRSPVLISDMDTISDALGGGDGKPNS